MRSLRLLGALAAVVFVLGLEASAQMDGQPADSLQAAVRARRIITNDDIPPRAEPPAKPAAAKAKSAKSPTDKPAADKPAAEKRPAEDLNKAIERIKSDEARIEEKCKRLEDKISGEADEFRRQMWSDSLDAQKVVLEQLHRERERLEQQLPPEAPGAPGENAAQVASAGKA